MGKIHKATAGRRLALMATAFAALAAGAAGGAQAQDRLTGVILRGPAPGAPRPPPPENLVLAPGLRIESPAGSWTEIAFMGGTTVVLEQGADFTLQGMARDPQSGRLVVRAAAGRGRLRINTASDVEMLVTTPGAVVRVVAGSAVVQAGAGGSATLLAGGPLLVRQPSGREDAVRRPGFGVSFVAAGAASGPERRTRAEQAAAMQGFAQVQRGGGWDGDAAVEPGGAANGRRFNGGDDLRPRRNEGTAIPIAAGSGGSVATPAGARAPGSSIAGSGIVAPRINASTTSIGAANSQVDPGSQEPDANIAGIASIRSFGTGRVRRIPAGASGGAVTADRKVVAAATRNDTGAIRGTGAGVAASSLFTPLSRSGEQLPQSGGITLYDAVARVGVVELNAFAEVRLADTSGGLNLVRVPRISVADSATPTAAFTSSSGRRRLDYTGSALFEVGLQNRDAGPQQRRESPTTPPEVLASTPTDGRVSRLFGEIGLISYVGATPLPDLVILGGELGTDDNGQPTRSGRTISSDGLAPDLNTPDRVVPASEVMPSVFIVDKITASSQRIFADRGIQEGERFFVIGGTPVPASGGLPGTAPGQVTRFAISDGMNPLGGFQEGATVEAQFNGADRPIAFSRFNAFRPDETFAGRPADARTAPTGRGDTHLLVVGGTPAAALRGEVEVIGGGGGSVSVSVGSIGRHGDSLVLSGNTYGTARLDASQGSLVIRSALGSLGTDAAGTGAHIFPSASDPASAGYFAVGTQDVRRGVPGSDGGQPGTIEPVGGGDSAPFGFTRLATNVSVGPGAAAPAALPQGGAAALRGFAAGIVESVRDGAVSLHGVSTEGGGGVAIDRAEGANTFAARIDLVPRAAGELAVNPLAAVAPNGVAGTQSLAFGGESATGQPTTAWIGQSTFGAVVPDRAALLSVDGDLLAGIAGGRSTMPASTEHLAWGMFLGDLVNDAGGTRRDHVNLGFWAAGRPVDAATLGALRGTASYGGGMIGTVAEPGSLRSVAGSFTQSWDFGARRGGMAADYDGRRYDARIAMPPGSAAFSGSGVTGDRRLVVQGGFFDARGAGTTTPPAGVGGAFGIAGPGYGANGVFVGRRP